jgi:hypothetical protein
MKKESVFTGRSVAGQSDESKTRRQTVVHFSQSGGGLPPVQNLADSTLVARVA